MPRRVTALMATAMLSAFIVQPVRADSYPSALIALYMDSTTTTVLYDIGCNIGTARSGGSAPQDGLVILDYGMPMKVSGVYGATAFGGSGGFASVTEIRNAVVAFGHGYWLCTGSNVNAHVRIGVGTSNYNEVGGFSSTDMTAHGTAWGNMLDSINADLVSNGYNSQVDAFGASDIEVSWSTPTNAKRWSDAYAAATAWGYYDFGDAAGCPLVPATASAGGCGGTWTQDSVYYVAWGNAKAYAVPEIYREDGVLAQQWQRISKHATLVGKTRIYFSGSMTQHGACGSGCPGLNNTALEGWQQLHDEINADSATSITKLRFATDIRWH